MMREKFSYGKNSFCMIFLVAFVAGIFVMNLGKSILLENTGLLDEDTLRQISSAFPDGDALFAFVLRKRLTFAVFMAVLATTYLGMGACVAVAFWYGLSTGMFLTAALLRYGFRGILLVAAGILPQYFVYIPVIYALLVWCDKTCRMIYLKEYYRQGDIKTPILVGRVFPLVIILFGMVAGCFLESFVNPGILQGFLKLL